jgi:microcystin-dependent protein
MSVTGNSALFALLGTTYGGNGVTTFNLPNLSTRIPIGYGNAPGRHPTELGYVSHNEIPTSTVPANTIKIVLDNP